MESTTPWQDLVPERKVRSVQCATALFSLSRFFVEAQPEITSGSPTGTWRPRPFRRRFLAAIEKIAQANEKGFVLTRFQRNVWTRESHDGLSEYRREPFSSRSP